MTTLTTYLQTMTNRVANYIGHMILRMIVLAVVATGLAALGSALDLDPYGELHVEVTATQDRPAGAPVEGPTAEHCEPSPKDTFHPCATLDTRTIDDLRTDSTARCLALDGVTMPDGTCVEASYLWADETDAATWERLLDYGFPVDLDDHDRMIVPAGFLVLDGDDVVSVDLSGPVHPILLG